MHAQRFFYALLLALGPAAAWAQEADLAGVGSFTLSDSFIAQVGAMHLYCSVYDLVSGDMGIFIGLGIAFFGFLMLLRQGLKMTNIILMAGGILLTALPGIFESFLSGTATTLQPLGGQNFTTAQGRSTFGDCEALAQMQQYGIAPLDIDLAAERTEGEGGMSWYDFGTESEELRERCEARYHAIKDCQAGKGSQTSLTQFNGEWGGGGQDSTGTYRGDSWGYGTFRNPTTGKINMRGLRNNNPCNVKTGSVNFGTGFIDCDCLGHAVYANPSQGFAACINNLVEVFQGRSLIDTIRKYAPASDGNNPEAYARQIAQNLGVSIHDVLDYTDPAVAEAFMTEMIIVEVASSKPYGENTTQYLQEGINIFLGKGPNGEVLPLP